MSDQSFVDEDGITHKLSPLRFEKRVPQSRPAGHVERAFNPDAVFTEKVGTPIKMDTVDPRAKTCPKCGDPGHLIGDNTAMCADHGKYIVPNISWPSEGEQVTFPPQYELTGWDAERLDALEAMVKRIAAHLGIDG